MDRLAPKACHFAARAWRALTRSGRRVRLLVRPLEHIWNLPAGLSGPLETEWRLVAIRWFGVLLMVPALQLIHLQQDRLFAAYGVLTAAAAYNLFVQNMLLRHPGLFVGGYLTTLGDGLLNVAMITLGGGFDTSFYLLLFTVTIAAAMRYGYGPTAAVVSCFIASDMIEGLAAGKSLEGAFLLRSGFLAL